MVMIAIALLIFYMGPYAVKFPSEASQPEVPEPSSLPPQCSCACDFCGSVCGRRSKPLPNRPIEGQPAANVRMQYDGLCKPLPNRPIEGLQGPKIS